MCDGTSKYLHFSEAIKYKNKTYDFLQIPIRYIKDERELLEIIYKSICFNNADKNAIKITGNKRVFDFLIKYLKVDINDNYYFAGFPFFLNPLLFADDVCIRYNGYEEALNQIISEEEIKKQKIKRENQLNKMILCYMEEKRDIPYQWIQELSEL
jgi:hypothetical protein